MFFSSRFLNIITISLLTIVSSLMYGQEIALFQQISIPENSFHTEKINQKTFKLQYEALNKLYTHKGEISFNLLINKKIHIINIHNVEIAESQQIIHEFNHGAITKHTIKTPHTYRGSISGVPQSLVALTTDGQSLRAVISVPREGQFNLGVNNIQKDKSIYLLSSSVDLTDLGSFSCSAIDDLFYREANNLDLRSIRSSCKKVRFSIHVDYDLFILKNRDMQEVTNYIYGLFNESGTIFLNEGIHTSISEIIIHTSEDNLPHTSATDDLSQFKRDFTSYNGDLIICLSGYRDQNNQAPLGGTAYTNSLCIKRYSYAYANVYGTYELYPNFSWDVQVFTHELGHVLGSPHTHSCSWGPQQNEALDDCYTTTGGCPPGPTPIKGTIMSYCHLPGRPGIDFTYGFGQEPGDRIRAKIESSNCLIDYIPEKNIPTDIGEVSANVECADGDINHYYFDNHTIDEADDIWLLSVDTKGQDIGHVGDANFKVSVEVTSNSQDAKEITANYVDPNKPFFVINKFWSFSTSKQPNNAVTVQFPFSRTEYESLSRMVPNIEMENLESYLIQKPGDANPAYNHRRTTENEFNSYTYSTIKSPNSWTYQSSPYGYHIAEYEVNDLDGGGVGVHAQSPLSVEIIYFKGITIEDNHQINWATTAEINLQNFVLERSADGILFEELITISSLGDLISFQEYEYIDESPINGKNYYRLKAIDADGSYSYTSVIQLYSNKSSKITYTISPNPILNGKMILSQKGGLNYTNIELIIRDIFGNIILQKKIHQPSTRHSIDVNGLNPGLYFVEILNDGQSMQRRVIVQ